MDYETVYETLIEIMEQGDFKEGAEEVLSDELNYKNIFSKNEQEEIIRLASELKIAKNKNEIAKELTGILIKSPNDAKIFIKKNIKILVVVMNSNYSNKKIKSFARAH